MTVNIELNHFKTQSEIVSIFELMQQLRSDINDIDQFKKQIEEQFTQNYKILHYKENDKIKGFAGYRAMTNSIYGRFLYVDDLVVDARYRGESVGAKLLKEIDKIALKTECKHVVLDTSLSKPLAQKFYFRNGFLARGMHFVRDL